jgi:hypothetical protein
MDAVAGPHPVLRCLAVVRAARGFGLAPDQLDPLTLRFAASVEELTEAVAGALLARG